MDNIIPSSTVSVVFLIFVFVLYIFFKKNVFVSYTCIKSHRFTVVVVYIYIYSCMYVIINYVSVL